MDHVIIHVSKPKECTVPRVKPNVNCGLGVMMTCRCRFINCNKLATLLEDVEMGEDLPV